MQKTDPIEIVPYDPHWPNVFESEATKIKKALDNHCIAIHHIGSTSVPGSEGRFYRPRTNLMLRSK